MDNVNKQEEVSQAGADIKKWKGMREDSSGKFVVYVTTTEERVFDDPDTALNYMQSKGV